MAWSLVGNIRGATGPAGVGVQYKGNVADAAALPPTGNTNGDMMVSLDDGFAHIWEDTTWLPVGQWLGPAGPTGSTGARGSLWNTGTNTVIELNSTNPIAGARPNDHYLHTGNGDVYEFQ